MLTRRFLLVAALAAFNFTVVAAEPVKPRLIDFNPWAWLPTSRNRSPSIMDYFFPPSRTPKNTNLQSPVDRTLSGQSTAALVVTPEESTTVAENLLTVPSRKSSTTVAKSKQTVPTTYETATTPPKTKKVSYKTTPVTAAETTFDVKSTKSSFTTRETVPTTVKPTKRYTIKPLFRVTDVTAEDSETTLESQSTENLTDGDVTQTTAAETDSVKETGPTLSTVMDGRSTDAVSATTITVETSTQTETTVTDAMDSREGYLPLRDKPQQTNNVKINEQTKKETVPLPAGSTSVLAKPTKYHYYPHNQHIYLLPECAIQQVCNAVYVRLNYTQPLCACPSRYRDPCSASLNADDLHTTRLTTDSKKKFASKAVTLVKTCEAVSEMRECRAPRDWSLLALQNIRTGKSHYLVICRCPENHILEGPMSHDQPTYASVPGIRVYGMMCVKPTSYAGYNPNNRFTVSSVIQSTTSSHKNEYSQPHSYTEKASTFNRFPSHGYLGPNFYNRMSRVARVRRDADYPPFPWHKVIELAKSLQWIE